jgi:hypothetical protein
MSDREFYDPSIEAELYEKGRVRDCEHYACHTPMGDWACVRRHLFVLQSKIDGLESDLRHYRAAAKKP